MYVSVPLPSVGVEIALGVFQDFMVKLSMTHQSQMIPTENIFNIFNPKNTLQISLRIEATFDYNKKYETQSTLSR